MKINIITNSKNFYIYGEYIEPCINIKKKFFTGEIIGFDIIIYSDAIFSTRKFMIGRAESQRVANKICGAIKSHIADHKLDEESVLDLRIILKEYNIKEHK
jgi:hypothetical protein